MILLIILAAVLMGVGVGVLAGRRPRAGTGLPIRIAVGLLAGLATLCLLVVLLMILIYVSLVEPWPLSLRHGPDTDYARDLFDRHVDRAGSDHVTDVYAWRQWGGPGEHVFFSCFVPRDPGLPGRVVRQWRLGPVSDAVRSGLRTWDDGPHWWPAPEVLAAARPMFSDGGGNPQAYTYFWPDVGGGRACLLGVDIG